MLSRSLPARSSSHTPPKLDVDWTSSAVSAAFGENEKVQGQFLAVDHSARASMKNAASCVN